MQAHCKEPEPYARQWSMGYLYLFILLRLKDCTRQLMT